MTWDAMRPFEKGRPCSWSEMRMCGVLDPLVLTGSAPGSLVAVAAPLARDLDHLAERHVEVDLTLDRDDPVVDEHDLRPPAEGPLARHIDGGGLQLGEEDVVVVGLVQVLREARSIGQPRGPPHHGAS